MSSLTRFIGGSPLEVAVRLLIISFVVGIVLTSLDLDPLDIIDGLQTLAVRVYNMGWDALGWAWRYLIVGAVVVVPIWLVMRFVKFSGGK